MKVYTEVPVSITGESEAVEVAVIKLEAFAHKLANRFDVTVMIHIDSANQPIDEQGNPL